MNEQVRQVAHQLRLFGVHAAFEQRALEASGKGLSHLEFLRLILEDEVCNRKNRSAQALLARAKFRSQVDLEDWDMSADRGSNDKASPEPTRNPTVEALTLKPSSKAKLDVKKTLGFNSTEKIEKNQNDS